MKKFLYLLLLLPLGFLTSCHDDDDMPSVDITVSIDNAVDADGRIFIVSGEPLTVSGITAEGLGGKAAGISGVRWLDSCRVSPGRQSPFHSRFRCSSG